MELLVVIGIVTMLLAMLLPALSSAKRMSQRVRATAGLREMMVAYTHYHIDHRGALLYGYTPATVRNIPVMVTDSVTGFQYGAPASERYPWRLAPYMENMWSLIHIHQQMPAIPQVDDPRSPPFTPETADYKAYMLSLTPAFGINSVFLGGHAGPTFGGFRGDVPNTGQHVAFKQSEIRNPARQIVFTEVMQASRSLPIPIEGPGYFFTMPPNANGERWRYSNGHFQIKSGVTTGLPKGRYGNTALVGFFDGHVAGLSPSELLDMRYWAPKADTPDYDFTYP